MSTDGMTSDLDGDRHDRDVVTLDEVARQIA
jgi:hypothetical protein